MTGILNIAEIKKIIPHRYPFLLIDRVLELEIGKKMIALKNVTANEDFFNGHFPEKPVMPGVLIIEAMAQAAAVFAAKSIEEEAGGDRIVYFMSIEKAHFRRPVEPGDSMHICVEQLQSRRNVWKMSGEAMVNGVKVADALFSAMLVKNQEKKSYAKIHETAIVKKGAKIHQGAEIGPYCVIGENVEVGDGVKLHSHICVSGFTKIGENTEVFPFASIGSAPQDLKYSGEESRVIIGKNNTIRENTTINVGTKLGNMETTIGDNCLLMIGSHIAHDCTVGNNVIMANNATLGGHVTLEDNVIIGGLAAIHQHVRIGKFSIVGGVSAVVNNVVPFASVSGDRAKIIGINIIGMQRKKFSREAIGNIREAFRKIFYNTEQSFDARVNFIKKEFSGEEVGAIIKFLEDNDNKRAFCMPFHKEDTDD
jgi:UDP-N-acetylglucosamine acyltransferase